MNEQRGLPYAEAAAAELSCAAQTLRLLASRRIRLPSTHLGMQLRFADGTSATVFRETVVDGSSNGDPSVLLVEFRLRLIRGGLHRLFRWESLLNTPLFVGFPGFVSKLWLAHDQHDVYRGVYDWDGPQRAEHYARSLWRVLALGCDPASIHYKVLPGLQRDELLAHPELIDGAYPDASNAWWRPVGIT